MKNKKSAWRENEWKKSFLVYKSHVKLTFEGSHIYLLSPAISVPDQRRVLLGCEESRGGMSVEM